MSGARPDAHATGGALQFHAALADRGLDAQFEVAAGEVLAILGPNGAGKSTLLHIIAGLLRPDTGVVRLGERVLTDTARGVQVATQQRRVGLLLQEPLLFPHLSVAANVAFGAAFSDARRRFRLRSGRQRVAAQRWLAEVDAAPLAGRKPRQLSGGQAQRVSIARALAAEPEVLLLDEPLSGLDVAAASAVRSVLRGVVGRGRRVTVLVTHDLLDVFALADRVLILESGRIAEIGRTAEVLTAPRSRFGARIAGLNLVRGQLGADGVLHTPGGQRWWGSAEPALRPGQPAVAVFSPAAVSVFRRPPPGSPRNSVAATVTEMVARGPTIVLRGTDQPDGTPGVAADITAEAAAELGLGPGERVWFCVKAQEVTLRATASHPGDAAGTVR